VVGAYDEPSPPYIWSPVLDDMHEFDEFMLVCSGTAVPGRHGPAKEGDGVHVLE
jgi:hypothetical protein